MLQSDPHGRGNLVCCSLCFLSYFCCLQIFFSHLFAQGIDADIVLFMNKSLFSMLASTIKKLSNKLEPEPATFPDEKKTCLWASSLAYKGLFSGGRAAHVSYTYKVSEFLCCRAWLSAKAGGGSAKGMKVVVRDESQFPLPLPPAALEGPKVAVIYTTA